MSIKKQKENYLLLFIDKRKNLFFICFYKFYRGMLFDTVSILKIILEFT